MMSMVVQEPATTDHTQSCREDHASDILRCYYGTLAQSLQYPIRVAQLLHGEGVISQTTLFNVKTTVKSHSEKEAIFLVLKAVRHAIHVNYDHLEVFASVLLKFTSNVPCAKGILKDYGKYKNTSY